MWLFRFKRFMAEREVFVSLIVFGICAMFADVLSDLGWPLWPAFIRGLGLAFLLFLLV
jgi:hypothetical protein